MKAWERNKRVKVFERWICYIVIDVKYVVSVYLLRFCVGFEPWQIRVLFPTHQAFCQGCLPDASPRACNRCRETWAEPWDEGRCSLIHFEECVGWHVIFLVILLWSNHMSHMDHIEHVLHLLPELPVHCLVLFLCFEVTHIFSVDHCTIHKNLTFW